MSTRDVTGEPRSELIESGLDLMSVSARIQLLPHGDWLLEQDSLLRKEWSGYGCRVILDSEGLRDGWSVTVDDPDGTHAVTSDGPYSRLEAFDQAARRMREIASNC